MYNILLYREGVPVRFDAPATVGAEGTNVSILRFHSDLFPIPYATPNMYEKGSS